MNRKQHPAAAKQRRVATKTGGHNHGGDDLCPGCTAKAVLQSCLGHNVKGPSGELVMYHLGEEPESEASLIFDFGVLGLRLDQQTAAITVISYGEEVFRMTPQRVEIDKRGPWLKTLAAIAADLEARFGKPQRPKEFEEEDDERLVECQGPDWEDAARERIAKDGQFILIVFGDPGELWFSYTIGNHEKGLPELIAVYPGGKEMSERLAGSLNHAGEIQRERGVPFEHGELVSLGGRLPVRIVDATIRGKAEYTLGVGKYYGTEDYQVRQTVLPDRDGRYPGDPLCAEPYASLPGLSPPMN
jgi:hypothetical protein